MLLSQQMSAVSSNKRNTVAVNYSQFQGICTCIYLSQSKQVEWFHHVSAPLNIHFSLITVIKHRKAMGSCKTTPGILWNRSTITGTVCTHRSPLLCGLFPLSTSLWPLSSLCTSLLCPTLLSSFPAPLPSLSYICVSLSVPGWRCNQGNTSPQAFTHANNAHTVHTDNTHITHTVHTYKLAICK